MTIGTTMQAYWNDQGQGPTSDAPVQMDLAQAQNGWSDICGVEGNFFGLIDAQGRAIQFFFTHGIPDAVEDARHLQIVLLDLPVPAQKGSYSKPVSVGEVHALMALAFRAGADPAAFAGLDFAPW